MLAAARSLPNPSGAPSALASSRIASLPDTTVQTFAYDDTGRLTQETRTGAPTTNWAYDEAGNRQTQTVGGATTTYSHDADNRLTAFTAAGVTTTLHYDANGSLRERAKTGETMTYAWDGARRLTQTARNGTTLATFAYDGDGNRTSKAANGQTTTYVNDGRGLAQVLQETTGAVTRTYLPGQGQYDPSKTTEPEKWGYTLSDGQSNRLLVDGNAALGHRWEWEPFGSARAESGSTQASFGYTGEQRDDETGLINLRSRYYDPVLGRFLSRDSIPGVMTLPQSWNRYSYVENDPVNHSDPSGHKKKKIKWPMGMDPDDDSHRRKKARACRNPGQYTGSCPGGPPNAAYAADGEAQHAAKLAGRAASAGNLAAAAAHLQSAEHFASIAGTSAALTAARQAFASIVAAQQSIQVAHRMDHRSATHNDGLMPKAMGIPIIPCSSVYKAIKCIVDGIRYGSAIYDAFQQVPEGGQDEAGTDFITEEGIDLVDRHLRTFGDLDNDPLHFPERDMVVRLRSGERTQWDVNFYVHELREFERMSAGESYETAHPSVLREQGLDPESASYLREIYHPDVIREHRTRFPREAWPDPDWPKRFGPYRVK